MRLSPSADWETGGQREGGTAATLEVAAVVVVVVAAGRGKNERKRL